MEERSRSTPSSLETSPVQPAPTTIRRGVRLVCPWQKFNERRVGLLLNRAEFGCLRERVGYGIGMVSPIFAFGGVSLFIALVLLLVVIGIVAVLGANGGWLWKRKTDPERDKIATSDAQFEDAESESREHPTHTAVSTDPDEGQAGTATDAPSANRQ